MRGRNFLSNSEMVQEFQQRNVFGNKHKSALREAFEAVKREWFVPENKVSSAYVDSPLAIPLSNGKSTTLSAPHMYPHCLNYLQVQEGDVILDVGSGTGYSTFLLAYLAGKSGKVIGIDIFQEIIDYANAVKEELKVNTTVPTDNVQFVKRNALLHDPVDLYQGYDRIFSGSECKTEHIEHFLRMLRPNGVIVTPCDGKLIRITLDENMKPTKEELMNVHYNKLIDPTNQERQEAKERKEHFNKMIGDVDVLNEYQSKIENLEKILNLKEQDILENEANNSTLLETIDELNNSLSQRDQQVSELQKSNTSLQEKVTELQKSNTNLQDKVIELERHDGLNNPGDLIHTVQNMIEKQVKSFNIIPSKKDYLPELVTKCRSEEKDIFTLWRCIQQLTNQLNEIVFGDDSSITTINDDAISGLIAKYEGQFKELQILIEGYQTPEILKVLRNVFYVSVMNANKINDLNMENFQTAERVIHECIEQIDQIKQQFGVLKGKREKLQLMMKELDEKEKNIRPKKRQYLKVKNALEMDEDEMSPIEIEETKAKLLQKEKEYFLELQEQENFENEVIALCREYSPHLYLEVKKKNKKKLSNVEEWLKKLGLLIQKKEYTIEKKWNNNIELIKPLSCQDLKVLKFVTGGKNAEMEILLLYKLKHPNIVPLEGVTITKKDGMGDPTELVLQMPFASQGTVWHWIYKQDPLSPIITSNQKRKRTAQEIKNVFRQIVTGIAHIHSKNVIHRDIKPGNVLINDEDIVWIADFGISKQKTFETTTSLLSLPGTTRIGTERYMAPEIIHGKHPSSERSDMYSLGVMLYEALFETSIIRNSNDIVFPKVSPISSLDVIEDSVKELLRQLLSDDPKKRPRAIQVLCHSYFMKDQIIDNLQEKRMIVDSKTRLQYFLTYLGQAASESTSSEQESIMIRRSHLVQDVIETFRKTNTKDELMRELTVHFDGEQGIDVGGLTRDMFTQFFQQIFNNQYSLFQRMENLFVPIPREKIQSNLDEKLEELEIVGRLMGRCMMTGHTLFVHLHPLVYDFLIEGDEAIARIQMFSSWMNQMKLFDREYARNLKYTVDHIKMGGSLDELYLDHTFQDEEGNTHVLNSKTAEMYGILEIKGSLGVLKEQLISWRSLRKGFLLCGVDKQLELLRGIELNMVINGADELKGSVLLQNIQFSENWSEVPKGSQIVEWFKFLVANDLNDGQLRRLLFWMTALVSIPLSGLSNPCTIHPSTKACMGHTCFFSLDLNYKGIDCYENLKKMVLQHLELVDSSEMFD